MIQKLLSKPSLANARRRAQRLALALAGAGILASLEPSARATVVERIVAVVGDKAILLSDLKQRAQPFLIQVHQTVPPGAQRNAAISQLYRSVLDRLVDEELEQRAAQQSKLSVTTKEVDEAMARVAAQNKITVEALIAEATKTGMNEMGYREELRRQLLEAKLINVRLQGRIRVVEEDLRDAYRKLVMEERQRLGLTPAWIVINVGHSGAEQRERRALAERIAEAARHEDFGDLARRYSEDANSRAVGGALAPVHVSDLPPALARIAMGLEVGQSSAVVRIGDRYVIFKVLKRDESELPDFEQAKNELSERVYIDKMAQAKKLWLGGLRRQHHVDVRL